MTSIIKDISVLKQKSIDVEDVGEASRIIKQIEPMLMDDGRMGLAAIQIGINKKVGVIKSKAYGFIYLINTEVLEKEDDFLYFNEGCLSFPGKFYNTKRYREFVIKNKRIENGAFEDETLYFHYDKEDECNKICCKDKLVSIAVQHEIDHFEGKIITEYGIKNEPVVRSVPKVGRNDLCPCGSGLKFKKCCLR